MTGPLRLEIVIVRADGGWHAELWDRPFSGRLRARTFWRRSKGWARRDGRKFIRGYLVKD